MYATYLLGHIAHCGQHPQHVEEAVVVVLALDGAACVALWQRLEDFRGDEFGAEQGRCRVAGGGLERHYDVLEAGCGCQSEGAGDDGLVWVQLSAGVLEGCLGGVHYR